MTWRTVVINQRAKLSFKMDNMVVRMLDNDIKRIYLKDISHVILNTTEVSITAALMNEFQFESHVISLVSKTLLEFSRQV